MSFHVPDTSHMNVYPRKNQNDLFGPPAMETVHQLRHRARLTINGNLDKASQCASRVISLLFQVYIDPVGP